MTEVAQLLTYSFAMRCPVLISAMPLPGRGVRRWPSRSAPRPSNALAPGMRCHGPDTAHGGTSIPQSYLPALHRRPAGTQSSQILPEEA
eukprot:810325-Rhodomonas_salina.4